MCPLPSQWKHTSSRHPDLWPSRSSPCLSVTLLALAVVGFTLLPLAFDQVHLVHVQRHRSPRRSFRDAAVDDLVFDTGEAVQRCGGPQQVLSELGILQLLAHDCNLGILGIPLRSRVLCTTCFSSRTTFEGTLQLFTLKEDVAHDLKEHSCTSSGQSGVARVM